MWLCQELQSLLFVAQSFIPRKCRLVRWWKDARRATDSNYFCFDGFKACHKKKKSKDGNKCLNTSESHYEWTHRVQDDCQHVLHHFNDQKEPSRIKRIKRMTSFDWLLPASINSCEVFKASNCAAVQMVSILSCAWLLKKVGAKTIDLDRVQKKY